MEFAQRPMHVSPTFRSGDYFAPMARPKKLPPRRTSTENWGFHAKTYAGIGYLHFDSKLMKIGRKGLSVSRGHHHTGGGVHKFDPIEQPHQVTSLRKSTCRADDQLVPNANRVDVVTVAIEGDLLTKKPNCGDCTQPVFEVFPKFDVSKTTQNMDDLTNEQKVLGAKNIAALEDLSNNLYKTTSNRRDYGARDELAKNDTAACADAKSPTDQPEQGKTVRIMSPTPVSGRERMFRDVSACPHEDNPRCLLCSCQINVMDFCEGTAHHPICNYCKSTGLFRLDSYDNPYALREVCFRPNGGETAGNVAKLSLRELRHLTGSKIVEKCSGSRGHNATGEPSLVTLIKAPVDKTHLYTSPLNYLGYYSGRRRNRLTSLIRKLPNGAGTYDDIDDVATPHEAQTPKTVELRKVAIPVSLKDRELLQKQGITCSQHFGEDAKRPAVDVASVMPGVHFPLSWEKGTRLDDDTESRKDVEELTSPGKIKVFKSLAHKKYDADFPELVPDLRELQKTSKKYFFHGYHASVFRG